MTVEAGLPPGTSGQLSWIVADSKQTQYELWPAKSKQPYRPPVGIGDTFHYNRPGGFDPLTAGMKNDQAIAVDWDHDGKLDLITGGESGMIYYFHRSTLEMKRAPKVQVTTYPGN